MKRKAAPPARPSRVSARQSAGTRSGSGVEPNKNIYSEPFREVQEVIEEKLFTAEEFFKDKPEILGSAIKVNGKYQGWIAERVMETYGIAPSASEAWESVNGGPAGKIKPQGWSNSKFSAYKAFKKNPNQYFYRHTEPGSAQDMGDWTEEEHLLYLETVRKYGVGDKWGLFASHIPRRVGYQCSNYYRYHPEIVYLLIPSPT